jgi:Protein of unknown function (DUF2568)
MSITTIGLGLHFVLELCALVAMIYAGFRLGDSLWMRLLLGVVMPMLAAVAWGVLRVPNDPGAAIIAVPGRLRLVLEWAIFGLAIGMLSMAGRPMLAIIFLVAVLIDYVIMTERVLRLLR